MSEIGNTGFSPMAILTPQRRERRVESRGIATTSESTTGSITSSLPLRNDERPLSDLDTAEDLRMPSERTNPWARIVQSMACTMNLLDDYGSRDPGDREVVREYARLCRRVAESLDRYADAPTRLTKPFDPLR